MMMDNTFSVEPSFVPSHHGSSAAWSEIYRSSLRQYFAGYEASAEKEIPKVQCIYFTITPFATRLVRAYTDDWSCHVSEGREEGETGSRSRKDEDGAATADTVGISIEQARSDGS